MHPVQNIVDDVYICGPKNSIRHPGSDDTGLTRTKYEELIFTKTFLLLLREECQLNY